jgi:hypothetical protein
MNDTNRPEMPRAQRIYGEIIYWTTIVACLICMIGPAIAIASPENNVLDPYKLFNAIFDGKTTEEIWNEAGDGFPGGHFYLEKRFFGYGDSVTQLGLALGCSCAFWGLLAAAAAYASEKFWLWVSLSLWVATLVCVSMIGIVSGGH